MLHIEGQCLGIATLSDQMSRIQSHVLVQNLVVLVGSGGTARKRPGQQGQAVTRDHGFVWDVKGT